MASFHPDDEFLNALKDAVSNVTDVINKYKQHDNAITSLAEMHAKNSGAPPEQMDAHVYMHKQAIKKTMAEHAKTNGQGGPGMPQGIPAAQVGNGPGVAPPSPAQPTRMQQVQGGPQHFSPNPSPHMPHMPPPGPQQNGFGPPRAPMA